VKSVTTQNFRKLFESLPEEVRYQARQSYRLWQSDVRHPSLHFRRVHTTEPVYSARVGLRYRALALVENDLAMWFWIGSHAEYDHLLRHL